MRKITAIHGWFEGKETEMALSREELERRVQELESEVKAIKAPTKKRHRVTFEFNEETYLLLRREAKRKGTSMANIVRDAISRALWLEETIDKGQLFVQEGSEMFKVKGL
jgi:predicted AlkP superfamily phosphohydrolase/phosphomutase